MQQRDSFITEIHQAALRDSRIMFLSADFGAPALDKLRQEIPGQFIHCGISEQNMVNVAVGLALSGKKPYIYAMSPFFLRAFEQLKLAAMHQVPITVVSVGAGLSYAGAGPTHYATEDIACYRTLVNTEVYTASTPNLAAALARYSVTHKGMMVVRLERGETPELYSPDMKVFDGYAIHGDGTPFIACGYLVHWLRRKGHSVLDLYRVKPMPVMLSFELEKYDYVHTFDEQYKEGGIGSAVLELLGDYGKRTRVFRRSLPERPIYENGTRDELLSELA
jgi:transketolase